MAVRLLTVVTLELVEIPTVFCANSVFAMSAFGCKADVATTCGRSYLILYLAPNVVPSSDTYS
jgi:hypothetical protein